MLSNATLQQKSTEEYGYMYPRGPMSTCSDTNQVVENKIRNFC